eukprot:gnl/Chilomastix_cuspidata/7704.p1 GENE.gnl/Chilomastix_cuspidata/7704~~gnl/Chilomastix_cuspidata/7704.p1  ORF type:complete len:351 (-),score=29.18 gnl/Chilomastix_cuspidata/7704:902-1954(-)
MTINSNNTFTSINLTNNKKVSNEENKDDVKNDVKKLSKEETIIKARNDYKGEVDTRIKMLNEHYSKVVQFTKQFESPMNHMHGKYFNPGYQYYIEGLTDRERSAAYKNEFHYFKSGELTGGSFLDPIFRERGFLYGDVEVARNKAFQRQEVNNQFSELLDLNKLSLPQDSKLRFTIDPNGYKVSISGLEDKNLINSLQNALNGDNAKQLFYHILYSASNGSSQVSDEKYNRFSVIRDTMDITGYNLNDLNLVDGKFLTNEGIDIFDIYKENIKNSDQIPDQFKGLHISSYKRDLDNLILNGFHSTPDLLLSIDYQNGSFYDVFQAENFGAGKTDWIDELHNSKNINPIYV